MPMETTFIYMSADGFAAFMDAIDAPARPIPEMVELFSRKPPWNTNSVEQETGEQGE